MSETTEATTADAGPPASEAEGGARTVQAEEEPVERVQAEEEPVERVQAEEEPVERVEASEQALTAVEAEEEPAADEPEAEAEPTPDAIADEAPMRVARVYLCERGHRTTVLWSTPTTCHARPLRNGPECGRQLYAIGELPEQIRRALNPLKASKKASKK